MPVQFVSRYGNKMNINNVDLSRSTKIRVATVKTNLNGNRKLRPANLILRIYYPQNR